MRGEETVAYIHCACGGAQERRRKLETIRMTFVKGHLWVERGEAMTSKVYWDVRRGKTRRCVLDGVKIAGGTKAT
jgi:hypothetical protein